jgi:hypothetical protein
MATKKIKMLLAYRETNAARLADRLGCSQANISQKLKRDNFSEKELSEIADVLGFDFEITFVDRLTGEKF